MLSTNFIALELSSYIDWWHQQGNHLFIFWHVTESLTGNHLNKWLFIIKDTTHNSILSQFFEIKLFSYNILLEVITWDVLYIFF